MDELSKNTYERQLEEGYTRNALYSISEGSVYAFGTGMIPLGTVITYFISGYVQSKTMLGMLSTLHILFFFMPQIFISPYVTGLKKFKPFFLKLAWTQRTIWLVISAAVVIWLPDRPDFFIPFFYVAYSFWGLMNGLTSNIWFNLITKIIPQRRLGRFLGMRFSINGVFEILGSLAVGVLLGILIFPYNYAVIFFIVWATGIASICLFRRIQEPDYVVERKKPKVTDFIKKLKGILRQDKNFVMYLLATYVIAFGKAAFGFQIVYAKEALSVTPDEVAVNTVLLFVSQTLGYVGWGVLNDKYGFKLSICVSTLLFIPGIILILLAQNMWLIYMSMFIFGIAQSARNAGENSLVISFCSEEDRPVYIGLRNFILAPAFAFGATFAGVLVDIIGYHGLFYISMVLLFIGFCMITAFVQEKRAI